MDINKYIGNKIREFRNKKNITQEELAEYLGTTPQTISRYEIGERKTNQDVLFALSDYFEISINDFFPKTVKEDKEEKYKTLLKAKGLMDENEIINEESLDKLLKIADMIQDIGKNKEDHK